jgi:hypothetical protein
MKETLRVRWKASLSNGETLYEGKGKYQWVDNEKSPWQKLMDYIANEILEITSLSLMNDGGQNFHLPSNGKNPRSTIFANIEKPLDYRMFRSVSSSLILIGSRANERNLDSKYAVIEATYPEYRLQLWVSEFNPENCWTVVLPN